MICGHGVNIMLHECKKCEEDMLKRMRRLGEDAAIRQHETALKVLTKDLPPPSTSNERPV